MQTPTSKLEALTMLSESLKELTALQKDPNAIFTSDETAQVAAGTKMFEHAKQLFKNQNMGVQTDVTEVTNPEVFLDNVCKQIELAWAHSFGLIENHLAKMDKLIAAVNWKKYLAEFAKYEKPSSTPFGEIKIKKILKYDTHKLNFLQVLEWRKIQVMIDDFYKKYLHAPNPIGDAASQKKLDAAQALLSKIETNFKALNVLEYNSARLEDYRGAFILRQRIQDTLSKSVKNGTLKKEADGSYSFDATPQVQSIMAGDKQHPYKQLTGEDGKPLPLFKKAADDNCLIDANDVQQDGAWSGSCPTLSALQAVAIKNPTKIRDAVKLVGEKNGINTYEVTLFTEDENNKAQKVKIKLTDEFYHSADKQNGLYTKKGDSEIWAMLIEKAAAALYGGYDFLNKGSSIEKGLFLVTGEKAEKMLLDEAEPNKTKLVEDLILFLTKHQNDFITLSTGGDSSHGYSVQSIDFIAKQAIIIDPISDDTGKKVLRTYSLDELVIKFPKIAISKNTMPNANCPTDN